MNKLNEEDEQIVNTVIDDVVEEIHNNHIQMLKHLSKEEYEHASILRDRTNKAIEHANSILSNIIGIDMLEKLQEQHAFIKQGIEDNIEAINQSKRK